MNKNIAMIAAMTSFSLLYANPYDVVCNFPGPTSMEKLNIKAGKGVKEVTYKYEEIYAITSDHRIEQNFNSSGSITSDDKNLSPTKFKVITKGSLYIKNKKLNTDFVAAQYNSGGKRHPWVLALSNAQTYSKDKYYKGGKEYWYTKGIRVTSEENEEYCLYFTGNHDIEISKECPNKSKSKCTDPKCKLS